MKDFCDIYYLAGIFDFEGVLLRKAIVETMEHRGHTVEEGVFDRIERFDQICRCFFIADFFREEIISGEYEKYFEKMYGNR